MTCILAATDLSTRSDRAVQRALRLSAKLKLPCRIVSVVDNDMPDDMLANRVNDVRGLVGPQEVRQIGICNAPALADVDGAKLALLDPVAHGRLGDLQAVRHFPDGLILVLWHGLLPFVEFDEE